MKERCESCGWPVDRPDFIGDGFCDDCRRILMRAASLPELRWQLGRESVKKGWPLAPLRTSA